MDGFGTYTAGGATTSGASPEDLLPVYRQMMAEMRRIDASLVAALKGCMRGIRATLAVWAARFGVTELELLEVLGGARTLYGSLEGVFEGEIGADFALALACIAAIAMGEPLVGAEVVFIGMVGESLEAITFGRTKRELRRLLELRPLTATLLRDGKVLITGGIDRGDYVFRSSNFSGGATLRRTAVLFDPFSRTVTSVGDMTTPRFFHSASLLPDGRVLISGGYTAVSVQGVLTVTKSEYSSPSRTTSGWLKVKLKRASTTSIAAWMRLSSGNGSRPGRASVAVMSICRA